MTTIIPEAKSEKRARAAAQAAEAAAYRAAKAAGRTEDSATRIACVAYERTYRQTRENDFAE